jgi:WD40 repeat protein
MRYLYGILQWVNVGRHSSTMGSIPLPFGLTARRLYSQLIIRRYGYGILQRNTCRQILDCYKYYIRTVVFSLDSKVLLSGSNDSKVRLWNDTLYLRLRELQGHGRPIDSMAFSLTGEVLASGSDDNIVRIWNTASGKLLLTLSGAIKEPTV